MKNKTVLIFIIFAAVLGALAFYLWRSAHQPRMRAPAKKHVVVPPAAAAKKARVVKVAVVMDDFGYNKNNLDKLFDIHEDVTLSILPGLRYSTEIARLALSRGYEVILHLPLEAHNKGLREESDTIRSGMKEAEIVARLGKEISTVPGLRGVSNHMGSKATEDKALMAVIFKYLKARNLYFLDSLTSQKSVCRETARSSGIPCARRDIFLDNEDSPEAIEKQVLALKKMAFKKGRVIAICHDRKNTVTVLAKMMPELARAGIEFVPLSELVK